MIVSFDKMVCLMPLTSYFFFAYECCGVIQKIEDRSQPDVTDQLFSNLVAYSSMYFIFFKTGFVVIAFNIYSLFLQGQMN